LGLYEPHTIKSSFWTSFYEAAFEEKKRMLAFRALFFKKTKKEKKQCQNQNLNPGLGL